MINFTFIIPHKNRTDLLSRCLSAIPNREDVQIIIVDDNSDPKQVDFDNFPGKDNPSVDIYFTKEGKGAGYARNVGLMHALGKWIVFADSDDYYLDNLSEIMDYYIDSESEMIIFRQKRVNERGEEINVFYNTLFDEAITTNNYEKLLMNYLVPYGRFLKRQFIESNHILFQEVQFSNDLMFFMKCGLLAKKVLVVDETIYCVCEVANSLMRNDSWKNPYIRTKVCLDLYSYVKSFGTNGPKDSSWKYFWKRWWLRTYELNKMAAIMLSPKIYMTTGKLPLVDLFRNKIIYYLSK